MRDVKISHRSPLLPYTIVWTELNGLILIDLNRSSNLDEFDTIERAEPGSKHYSITASFTTRTLLKSLIMVVKTQLLGNNVSFQK